MDYFIFLPVTEFIIVFFISYLRIVVHELLYFFGFNVSKYFVSIGQRAYFSLIEVLAIRTILLQILTKFSIFVEIFRLINIRQQFNHAIIVFVRSYL